MKLNTFIKNFVALLNFVIILGVLKPEGVKAQNVHQAAVNVKHVEQTEDNENSREENHKIPSEVRRLTHNPLDVSFDVFKFDNLHKVEAERESYPAHETGQKEQTVRVCLSIGVHRVKPVQLKVEQPVERSEEHKNQRD